MNGVKRLFIVLVELYFFKSIYNIIYIGGGSTHTKSKILLESTPTKHVTLFCKVLIINMIVLVGVVFNLSGSLLLQGVIFYQLPLNVTSSSTFGQALPNLLEYN